MDAVGARGETKRIAGGVGCLIVGLIVLIAGSAFAFFVNDRFAAQWLSRSAPVMLTREIPTAAAGGLKIPELTDAQRRKGISECDPPDPLGLGPYSGYERLLMGRLLVPQRGGHTDDMGYDVVVHFNGGDAVRKMLTQTAHGVSLVMVDRGSPGEYKHLFDSPGLYVEFRKSIEAGLRRHAGDGRAHIRHLAVSSWSAGELAIHALLEQKQSDIDAYVVLDGLHTAYSVNKPHVFDIRSLNLEIIRPEVELARRALRGETIFVLTHSDIDPPNYPSTRLTADLLLSEIGQKRVTTEPTATRFYQSSAVDAAGLHVWGFRGKNEYAHCAQLQQIARAVTEVIEPAWGTPGMDRSVPNTPLPGWERRRH